MQTLEMPAGMQAPRQAPGLRSLDTFEVLPVAWMMPGRIPYGHVTVLAGSPGEGKSTMTMALAAGVTQAGLGCVFVGSEDDIASSVRPRFQAAGGDVSKFFVFGHDIDPVFPEDAEFLEKAVRDSGAGLVIIDPITAHLSPLLNTMNDHSLRQGLRPLARLAQRTRAAVIVVMHLNKGREGSPLNWLNGSGGFGGIARSVLLFGTRKTDADELANQHFRYLHRVKGNLAPPSPALCCTIETAYVDTPDGRVQTSRLLFHEEDEYARPEELR